MAQSRAEQGWAFSNTFIFRYESNICFESNRIMNTNFGIHLKYTLPLARSQIWTMTCDQSEHDFRANCETNERQQNDQEPLHVAIDFSPAENFANSENGDCRRAVTTAIFARARNFMSYVRTMQS